MELIDGTMGNIFRKYFEWFGGLGLKSGPFLISDLPTYCNFSKSTYDEFVVFCFFEDVHWDDRNSKYHLLIMKKLHYIANLSEPKKG